jgi:hypothetical protein
MQEKEKSLPGRLYGEKISRPVQWIPAMVVWL